jgi:serine/threonine protein phosphatase PrpC
MNISAAYYSSRGGRKNNEDSISLLENADNVLALVADGLGGSELGEVASQTAIRAINGRLSGGEINTDSVTAAICEANREILDGQTAAAKMKTTIALLFFSDSRAVAANVGDSRIYQFRGGAIAYQSSDHSVSQMAVLVGEIGAGEIRGHHDRNKLTRALGSKEAVKVDCAEFDCRGGDAFLLCSDGFWEYVLEREMSEDLSKSENAGEWLAKMRKRVETRMRSNADNHSAVAIIAGGRQREDG